MLKKYSNTRSLADNIRLGVITAFSAGMVNILTLIIFFAFSSNVTGHYAILASEIAMGNWYQVAVVFSWIFLFFFGNFVSNYIVISYNKRNAYIAHALPVAIEMLCLLSVGIYGSYYYRETLQETEVLVALCLFAMGLQNGLTASISNFAVKTTHLTGATTDLGILASMFTKKEYRENEQLMGKFKLIFFIALSYMFGGVIAGLLYFQIGFKTFYVVCVTLIVVIGYDYSKLELYEYFRKNPSTDEDDDDMVEVSTSETPLTVKVRRLADHARDTKPDRDSG